MSNWINRKEPDQRTATSVTSSRKSFTTNNIRCSEKIGLKKQKGKKLLTRKPVLTWWSRTADETLPESMKRSPINFGSTFFGKNKPNKMCLDQMGSSVLGVELDQDYHTMLTVVVLEREDTWMYESQKMQSGGGVYSHHCCEGAQPERNFPTWRKLQTQSAKITNTFCRR